MRNEWSTIVAGLVILGIATWSPASAKEKGNGLAKAKAPAEAKQERKDAKEVRGTAAAKESECDTVLVRIVTCGAGAKRTDPKPVASKRVTIVIEGDCWLGRDSEGHLLVCLSAESLKTAKNDKRPEVTVGDEDDSDEWEWHEY